MLNRKLAEQESLSCPKCGHRLVLVTATMPCIAMPRNSVGMPLGIPFGTYDSDTPIPLGDNSPAFCNHVGCGWEGTYKEVAG